MANQAGRRWERKIFRFGYHQGRSIDSLSRSGRIPNKDQYIGGRPFRVYKTQDRTEREAKKHIENYLASFGNQKRSDNIDAAFPTRSKDDNYFSCVVFDTLVEADGSPVMDDKLFGYHRIICGFRRTRDPAAASDGIEKLSDDFISKNILIGANIVPLNAGIPPGAGSSGPSGSGLGGTPTP